MGACCCLNAAMTDADLQGLVAQELAFDPRIDASDIAIGAAAGVITLRGRIRSLTEKWQAIEDAKHVLGVAGIADELILELRASHQRTDTDIARALATRFESSTIVPEGVKFVVKEARVTLTGEVAWNYQRDEAIREARSVAGVREVVDDVLIEIAPPPAEEAVRERIHGAFARDAERTAKNIFVTVDDTTVILRGRVRSWMDRERAERAAWTFRGIARVDNRIEILP